MSSVIGVDGLSNLYGNRSGFAVFEIKQIADYPMIETQDNVGSTSCSVVVGIAEDQTIDVDFTSLGYGETPPCPEAERIAELVIGNLPPLN